MTRIRLRLILTVTLTGVMGLAICTAGSAVASTQPACPAGQVPNWNNTACIAVQPAASIAGYGIPSQQKAYLPGGTVNSALAMQNCNGVAVPLGQPCSAATASSITMPVSELVATAQSQTSSSSVSSSPPPSIIIDGPGPSTPGAPISSTPGNTAANAFVDPMATLENLIGDWYTGWLQYLAAAFNFNQDNQETISAQFLSDTPCLQAQATACQAAIWQQISQWVGPSLGGS